MIRTLPLVLSLAACTPAVAPAGASPPAAEITYETGACFGSCPVYAVTVTDGRSGMFEGKRFTAVEGRRAFAVSQSAFDAFSGALAEARAAEPKSYEGGGANCRQQVSDMPSVAVTFREGAAPPRVFRFDYGCRDPRNAALAESLRRAPDMLPIAAFIGDRAAFVGRR